VVTATQPAGQTRCHQRARCRETGLAYITSCSLPEFKTQSHFSGLFPTSQTTYPVVFRSSPSSRPRDQASCGPQSVTLGFWTTQLAQSDFAQEMKKVQGRLDPWGLGGGGGTQKGSSWQRPFVYQGLVTKCLLSRPGGPAVSLRTQRTLPRK
jgi:hypothetical protein